MDDNGQITIEFIILIGIILIVIVGLISYLGEDMDLIQIMSSARCGAIKGANMDSFAIYPTDSFNNNNKKYPRLLSPSNVKIVSINYENQGYNPFYNKTKIQLNIIASCPTLSENDKNPAGDRINFYARKCICETFNTTKMTNSVFNPAFSTRYIITTADVNWI